MSALKKKGGRPDTGALMVFKVKGPGGRSDSISLQGRAAQGRRVATLGNLRAELFKRFDVLPFEQHLELKDGSVLQGDDSNPLDAPFLKLGSALEKALPLRLSTRTDPRHTAEKNAAFVDCLTSTPPKLDIALRMLRHPSGVPIDPNLKATAYLDRFETCVYSRSRSCLPPITYALWVEKKEKKEADVVAVVEELLAQGADPNLTGDEDVSCGSGMGGARYPGTMREISPLCHAVQRGSAECVLRLLAAGADPNHRSSVLGPEGGLPETFLDRGFVKGAVRDDILALLAAARQLCSAPSGTSSGGTDRQAELTAALRSVLKKRVSGRAQPGRGRAQPGRSTSSGRKPASGRSSTRPSVPWR